MPELPASAIRAWAFLRKEVTEVLRQPQLVLTLIVGPFLILLLFGAGLGDLATTVRTAFVVPAGSPALELLEGFQIPLGSRVRVEGLTSDREDALARLRDGELDLVVEVPADAQERFAADEQATVVLHHNYIDPIESRALILAVGRTVGAINDQVLRGLVAQGQVDAEAAAERVERARQALGLARQAVERGDVAAARERLEALREVVGELDDELSSAAVAPLRVEGLVEGEADENPASLLADVEDRVDALAAGSVDLSELEDLDGDLTRMATLLEQFQRLSPETIVNPFAGRIDRLGEASVGLTDFYAPAVVALLLQHLVLTVVCLSAVRDEQLGTSELFRVAPVSPAELLVGRYLAALVIGGIVAAGLLAVLLGGLGVPMIGSWGWLAVSVAGVIVASCGLGLLLAALSRSDTQAVQYAMMVLLASLLLSGFVLTLDYFLPPVRVLARFLPATLGIELLRTLMLRGADPPLGLLAILAGMGVALFTANWLLLRRRAAAR